MSSRVLRKLRGPDRLDLDPALKKEKNEESESEVEVGRGASGGARPKARNLNPFDMVSSSAE